MIQLRRSAVVVAVQPPHQVPLGANQPRRSVEVVGVEPPHQAILGAIQRCRFVVVVVVVVETLRLAALSPARRTDTHSLRWMRMIALPALARDRLFYPLVFLSMPST
jgi:hypothetical protein